mmetsp:Transcript_14287/g.19099  ORF Transcript_14287/g.19099 Transcript_14287/m.19099 type:complete len:127 (+) Transcript_14287:39-419(+)
MGRPLRRIAFAQPYRFKLPKGDGPILFKYVQSCTIKFDPFDEKGRALREIHRELSSTRYLQANPKVQIHLDMQKNAEPNFKIKYINGFEIDIENVAETDAKTILSEIFYEATHVRFEYLRENKPLP